jgi:hypothetical protein
LCGSLAAIPPAPSDAIASSASAGHSPILDDRREDCARSCERYPSGAMLKCPPHISVNLLCLRVAQIVHVVQPGLLRPGGA